MRIILSLFLIILPVVFVNGQTDVTWHSEQNVSINGNVISKSGNGQGHATSEQVLLSYGKNNYVYGSFSFTTLAEKGKQIGYSVVSNEYFSKKEFTYSILFNKVNEFKVVENGIVKGTFPYNSNDQFEIKRGEAMQYYQNGNIIYSNSDIDLRENLEISVMLKRKNTSFDNVQTSYATQELKIEVDVDNHNLIGTTNVSGGANTKYYYEWSNGSSKEILKAFEKGVYTLRVSDTDGNEDYAMVSFGDDITWQDFNNGTSQSGVKLSKSGNGWGTAFSSSIIDANKNGWFEHSLTDQIGNQAIGLIESNIQSINDPTDIQYGFYISKKGFIKMIVNGSFDSKYNFDDLDIVKVDRVDDKIYYYSNGVLLKEITVDPSEELKLVAMLRNGTSMSEVRMDMEKPKSIYAEFDESIGYGKITANVVGGVPPYRYVISEDRILDPIDEFYFIRDSIYADTVQMDSVEFVKGNNPSNSYSFESLELGRYYVAIFDDNGIRVAGKRVSLNKNLILNLASNGISFNGNVIKSDVANSLGGILNYIADDENGLIEFKIFDPINRHFIGLNDLTQSIPKIIEDFYFGVLIENSKLSLWNNGVTVYSAPIRKNTKISFEKDERKINLYIGKKLVHSIDKTDNKELSTYFGFSKRGIKLKPFYHKPIFYRPASIRYTTNNANCYSSSPNSTLNASLYIPSFFNYQIISTSLQLYENGVINASNLLASSTTGTLSLNNLEPGVYLLNGSYTYSFGPFSETYFFVGRRIVVGYDVNWDNHENAISSPDLNTVLKNEIGTPLQFDYDAGASSNNLMGQIESNPNDEWIELTVKYNFSSEYWNHRNSLTFSNSNIVTIDEVNNYFRFLIFYGPRLSFAPINSNVFSGPLFALFEGDRIMFRKDENDIIKVYRNYSGNPSIDAVNLVYTSTDTYSDRLYTIVNITGLNSGFENAICNYSCEHPNIYADLTKKLDGGYYTSNGGILPFIYNEQYNDLDDNLEYKIFNSQNIEVASNLTDPVILDNAHGDNRFKLDFSCGATTPLGNGYYTLEVTNEKKEKFLLRFKIINSNC